MKPFRTDIDYNMAEEFPDDNITGIYRAVSYHRNGTKSKSQWLISVDDEIGLFANAKKEGYTSIGTGHSVWVVDSQLLDLGITTSGITTKLARFVDGTHTDNWHGYPANYISAKSDIPPTCVLHKWADQNFISKSDITKIQKQRPCKLQRSV